MKLKLFILLFLSPNATPVEVVVYPYDSILEGQIDAYHYDIPEDEYDYNLTDGKCYCPW
jgi:hypothetical protein